MDPKALTAKLTSARVLLVDDEPYMRKVVRTMLLGMGVRAVHEADDGPTVIRTHCPDVVILDWEMPGLNGTSFVRMVRSPERFPLPDTPIIMLIGHGEKQRVMEAVCIGVNEFLLKPVSTNALRDRLVFVLVNPRKMVSSGPYYGPMPRNLRRRCTPMCMPTTIRPSPKSSCSISLFRRGLRRERRFERLAHRHRPRHDLDPRDRVRRGA